MNKSKESHLEIRFASYFLATTYESLFEIKQPIRHQLNPLAALIKIVQKICLHNPKVEKNRQIARVMIQC